MPKIFISYRRDDSGYATQQIRDELCRHFGKESVIFDVDSIPFGIDFRKYLDDQVKQCDVLLAVIGSQWLDMLKQHHDTTRDFVRIEIEAALKRNIPVVPVLVGKAAIPNESDLPASIAELVYRNATEVRAGADMRAHLKRLVDGLVSLLGSKKTSQSSSEISTIHQPGTVFRDQMLDGSDGPEMVVIPSGTFRMGDLLGTGFEDELPVHKVHITKTFALGRYPLTFDEYDYFTQATGTVPAKDSKENWGRGRRPVINVSWEDAVCYCEWLSEQSGESYRLPTESEWEYAARGGHGHTWAGTSNESELEKFAWYDIDPFKRDFYFQTHPVGEKKANAFGLFDMCGNMGEWVQDCTHANYEMAPTDGTAWLHHNGGNCDSRMVRGGTFMVVPQGIRCANRHSHPSASGEIDIGFRVVREIR